MQVYREAGANLPADTEGDVRWDDATEQKEAYVDRQNSVEPPLYLYRAGAAHTHHESGNDFKDSDRYLPEHQYSRRRGGLDLHRAKSGGNRGAGYHCLRTGSNDGRR